MLKKIQQFFDDNFSTNDASDASIEHQLNLAAGALLIEMILQDDEVKAVEIQSVKHCIVSVLKISEAEADELYALAEAEKSAATDYHQFTKLIAEHYTQAQKIELIEALWRVAFPDNQLDKYEENMVRRISDLIYVSHKDFIQAKHRVEEAMK